jgi:hypothetical protein
VSGALHRTHVAQYASTRIRDKKVDCYNKCDKRDKPVTF